MSGSERLKTMLAEWTEKNKNDPALNETVDYLLKREDLEQKFLNEEKSVDGLDNFIKDKGRKHLLNGWCFITNEVVFSWAVMYFSLPNSFLKINSSKSSASNKNNNKKSEKEQPKNNIISLEDAKKKVEKEKEVTQISLFGGDISE